MNYSIGDRRYGDVEAAYADTTKANEQLNWVAKTSLNDTIFNAWHWEKKIRNIN